MVYYIVIRAGTDSLTGFSHAGGAYGCERSLVLISARKPMGV